MSTSERRYVYPLNKVEPPLLLCGGGPQIEMAIYVAFGKPGSPWIVMYQNRDNDLQNKNKSKNNLHENFHFAILI